MNINGDYFRSRSGLCCTVKDKRDEDLDVGGEEEERRFYLEFNRGGNCRKTTSEEERGAFYWLPEPPRHWAPETAP